MAVSKWVKMIRVTEELNNRSAQTTRQVSALRTGQAITPRLNMLHLAQPLGDVGAQAVVHLCTHTRQLRDIGGRANGRRKTSEHCLTHSVIPAPASAPVLPQIPTTVIPIGPLKTIASENTPFPVPGGNHCGSERTLVGSQGFSSRPSAHMARSPGGSPSRDRRSSGTPDVTLANQRPPPIEQYSRTLNCPLSVANRRLSGVS